MFGVRIPGTLPAGIAHRPAWHGRHRARCLDSVIRIGHVEHRQGEEILEDDIARVAGGNLHRQPEGDRLAMHKAHPIARRGQGFLTDEDRLDIYTRTGTVLITGPTGEGIRPNHRVADMVGGINRLAGRAVRLANRRVVGQRAGTPRRECPYPRRAHHVEHQGQRTVRVGGHGGGDGAAVARHGDRRRPGREIEAVGHRVGQHHAVHHAIIRDLEHNLEADRLARNDHRRRGALLEDDVLGRDDLIRGKLWLACRLPVVVELCAVHDGERIRTAGGLVENIDDVPGIGQRDRASPGIGGFLHIGKLHLERAARAGEHGIGADARADRACPVDGQWTGVLELGRQHVREHQIVDALSSRQLDA